MADELPRWQLPLVGFVCWWLLRGRSPEWIRQSLRESSTYPDVTDAEYERIYARGLADCQASLKGRSADLDTRLSELFQ